MIRGLLRGLLARLDAEPVPPPPDRFGSPESPLTPDEMMPPEDDVSVGKGGFRAIGLGLLQELKDACGLQPHHRVLDVGCGIGRVAIPLTQYLSPPGAYEGFDPVAKSIRYCQARISPSYPHFRFQVADLYNKTYNPRGRYRDAEFRFPYDDASFDVAFAASVFTHLLPAGTERYVAETARVLKPGGRFFATFFLLNEASKEALAGGRSTIGFRPGPGAHRIHSRRHPEAAVAYEESFVLRLFEEHGLPLTQPPAYGFWSGRPPSGYGGYQDLLVGARASI
jgi:SAM-dependent methyltransferase